MVSRLKKKLKLKRSFVAGCQRESSEFLFGYLSSFIKGQFKLLFFSIPSRGVPVRCGAFKLLLKSCRHGVWLPCLRSPVFLRPPLWYCSSSTLTTTTTTTTTTSTRHIRDENWSTNMRTQSALPSLPLVVVANHASTFCLPKRRSNPHFTAHYRIIG